MDNQELALNAVIHATVGWPVEEGLLGLYAVHRATYLAQEMGVPLGYDFEWNYTMPISSRLNGDFLNLAAKVGNGDSDVRGIALHPDFGDELLKLKELIVPPKGVPQNKWELMLASTHFLESKLGEYPDDVHARMKAINPALGELVAPARQRLVEYALLEEQPTNTFGSP